MNTQTRTIAIIGGGFVGSATSVLGCEYVKKLIYDINPERCIPKGTTLNDLKICDLIFIAVPTPTTLSGKCDLKAVDSVARDLKSINFPPTKVVLRCTVPPGTSDKYGFNYMPEFLTEKNYLVDFVNNPTWLFGAVCKNTELVFTDIINLAHKAGKIKYNNIMYIEPTAGELVKLTRNNFLAVKVSFFNEIYDLCQKIGIDYNNVRSGVGADPRIGLSHTTVPNYEFGNDTPRRGWGGTCFEKDKNTTLHCFKENNLKNYVLSSASDRNLEVDRPNMYSELDSRALSKE